MTKSFEAMTIEQLADSAAALANMRVHPGWSVMIDLLGRMEHATLERMGECKPDELTRLQGERDALSTFRRLLEGLPEVTEVTLQTAVEEGHVDEEELARFALRSGGGDIGV